MSSSWTGGPKPNDRCPQRGRSGEDTETPGEVKPDTEMGMIRPPAKGHLGP